MNRIVACFRVTPSTTPPLEVRHQQFPVLTAVQESYITRSVQCIFCPHLEGFPNVDEHSAHYFAIHTTEPRFRAFGDEFEDLFDVHRSTPLFRHDCRCDLPATSKLTFAQFLRHLQRSNNHHASRPTQAQLRFLRKAIKEESNPPIICRIKKNGVTYPVTLPLQGNYCATSVQ